MTKDHQEMGKAVSDFNRDVAKAVMILFSVFVAGLVIIMTLAYFI